STSSSRSSTVAACRSRPSPMARWRRRPAGLSSRRSISSRGFPSRRRARSSGWSRTPSSGCRRPFRRTRAACRARTATTSRRSSPWCARRIPASPSSSTTTAAPSAGLAPGVKVHLTTLGCPKNQVDSELMLGMLAEAGFPAAARPEDAECLIVNTCAFIDRARQESVDTILELAQLKQDGACRSLIVTGCLTQRYGSDVLDEIPEVDGILGTSELHRVVDLVRQAARRHDWATSAPPGYLYDAATPRLLAAR